MGQFVLHFNKHLFFSFAMVQLKYYNKVERSPYKHDIIEYEFCYLYIEE